MSVYQLTARSLHVGFAIFTPLRLILYIYNDASICDGKLGTPRYFVVHGLLISAYLPFIKRGFCPKKFTQF